MDTASLPLWIGFNLFVLAMLALDLGVFHRKAHAVSLREAATWSGVWIALALAFNFGVWHFLGPQKGVEFLTGYLIEKSLSIDNIFVFAILFAYFAVPAAFQHRVLFWGILGALVLRAVFIVLGAALLARFQWLIYLFGVFLLVTGIKLLLAREVEVEPEKNPVLRLVRRFLPVTPAYHGHRFLVRLDGRLFATPLLLVLVVIEATDVVFAVDSIPAIFGVTRDPFIVFTSNIFAILGLRSLYFLLSDFMDRFHYLSVGLGLVLSFIGLKMVGSAWFHVPIGISLGVIVALLGGSVLASFLFPPRAPSAQEPEK